MLEIGCERRKEGKTKMGIDIKWVKREEWRRGGSSGCRDNKTCDESDITCPIFALLLLRRLLSPQLSL